MASLADLSNRLAALRDPAYDPRDAPDRLDFKPSYIAVELGDLMWSKEAPALALRVVEMERVPARVRERAVAGQLDDARCGHGGMVLYLFQASQGQPAIAGHA